MKLQRLLALAALILPGFDVQAQTVTDPGWVLNAAGTPYTTQPLCIAAAEALPKPAPGQTAKSTCVDTTTIIVATPLPPPSAAGAYLTGPTATAALTDAAGTAWTLTAGVVYSQPVTATAPAKAGYSAGVGTLLWFGGKIHQQNPVCLWWNWSGTTWVSETSPGTTALPACPAASSSSSSGGSGSSSSGGPPVAFGVRASGNKLVSTLNGAPVILIGGVISGCETNFAPGRCAAIAAVGSSYWSTTWRTQHAGTNTVRIHVDGCSYLALACAPSGNAGTAANVQKIVADNTTAGNYVIIDLIWSAPAGQQSIGQPGFADSTVAPQYWKAIADKYGSQPNVIFDLFNEPFGENVYADWMAPGGKDVAIVANGGSYTPFMQQNNSNGNAMVNTGATYQVEGELPLLALVRGEGATNLVLASPTGWAGEIENWLASYNVKGNPDPLKNFGASQHAYGYNSGIAPIQAVQAAGYPVIETEFEGSTVGNIGLQNAINLGLSLIGCCSNAWNGSSISLVKW